MLSRVCKLEIFNYLCIVKTIRNDINSWKKHSSEHIHTCLLYTSERNEEHEEDDVEEAHEHHHDHDKEDEEDEHDHHHHHHHHHHDHDHDLSLIHI